MESSRNILHVEMASDPATPVNRNSPPPVRPELSASWWSIGLFAILFVVLAIVTTGSNTLRIDLTVSRRVQTFDGPAAELLGWFGDYLGETTVALSLATIGLIAAILLRSVRDAWFLGIAAILRLAATFLKGVFDSPRPTIDQVDQARVFESTGFPSGHATTASLLMGTVAFLVARRTNEPAIRAGMLALWATGVAITGFARIWHGAHWFTDTVGGAIVGLVIVLVAANLSSAIVRRRATGQPQSRPQTPTP